MFTSQFHKKYTEKKQNLFMDAINNEQKEEVKMNDFLRECFMNEYSAERTK